LRQSNSWEARRHGGWEAGRHGGWKARKLESPSYCLPRDIGKRTPVCRVGIAHPQGNFDPKPANILTAAGGEGAFYSPGIALVKFQEVVLFTAHDHEFVITVANRIVEIIPGGVIGRHMTFDEYIESTKVAQTRQGMIRKAA
jgi:hypothetical protein